LKSGEVLNKEKIKGGGRDGQKGKINFIGNGFSGRYSGKPCFETVFLVVKPVMATQTKILTVEGLQITDAKGEVRARIIVTPYGGVGFSLADNKGQSRAMMIVSSDGTVSFRLFDDKGIRAGMGLKPDGSPGITLFDEKGKIIWSAP